jgi:hypothetical protein
MHFRDNPGQAGHAAFPTSSAHLTASRRQLLLLDFMPMGSNKTDRVSPRSMINVLRLATSIPGAYAIPFYNVKFILRVNRTNIVYSCGFSSFIKRRLVEHSVISTSSHSTMSQNGMDTKARAYSPSSISSREMWSTITLLTVRFRSRYNPTTDFSPTSD